MPFTKLGLNPLLVQATREMRYEEPTPIQAKAIPVILAGNDLIATAQTGTGKTAAFLLPILHALMDLPKETTQALIITPTRELAAQIDDVCMGLCYHTPIRVALLVGGSPMGPQEKAMQSGAELVIATPGRLLDHMRQSQVRFDHLHTLVLDEADRMLDMGFLPDLKRIVARLPARDQTLLFSATMPPVIVNLAKDILDKPEKIQIGRRSAPAVGITQAAYPIAEPRKKALLLHLLRNMEMPSVLVFTRTKQAARRLSRALKDDGFVVAELHGNLTQPERDRAMDGFRRGDYQVLVATNIAARGLDVDHITHVISFDVPNVPEDYVHRIGRTARAKAQGDAFIFFAPSEERSLVRIERQIGQRLPRVTLPEFDYNRSEQSSSRGPSRGRSRQPSRSGPARSASSTPRAKSNDRAKTPPQRPPAARIKTTEEPAKPATKPKRRRRRKPSPQTAKSAPKPQAKPAPAKSDDMDDVPSYPPRAKKRSD